MRDEEIIERIKKKDYAGLEELLAVYGDSMLRTIHSVLSQPHEVSERQDVANEVFYEVWQKIAAYQPERSRLITWLLLISRSRAIDHKRKLNKRSLEEKPVDEQELAIEESPLTKETFLGFKGSLCSTIFTKSHPKPSQSRRTLMSQQSTIVFPVAANA